jgi:hypothetical protein
MYICLLIRMLTNIQTCIVRVCTCLLSLAKTTAAGGGGYDGDDSSTSTGDSVMEDPDLDRDIYGIPVNSTYNKMDLANFFKELRAVTLTHECFVCGGRRPRNDFKSYRLAVNVVCRHGILDLGQPLQRVLLLPLLKSDALSLEAPNDPCNPRSYQFQPELVEQYLHCHDVAHPEEAQGYPMRLCCHCKGFLSDGEVPPLCYARYPLSPTPPVLKGLSTFETAAVSYCVPMLSIVLLKSAFQGANQVGHVGLSVCFRTNNPAIFLAEVLPRHPDNIILECVVQPYSAPPPVLSPLRKQQGELLFFGDLLPTLRNVLALLDSGGLVLPPIATDDGSEPVDVSVVARSAVSAIEFLQPICTAAIAELSGINPAPAPAADNPDYPSNEQQENAPAADNPVDPSNEQQENAPAADNPDDPSNEQQENVETMFRVLMRATELLQIVEVCSVVVCICCWLFIWSR